MSWTIGQLARRNDVGVETVRFYERRGLLRQPEKPANGRRLYTAQHDRCLRFIRRAQRLGFSLDEIALLLELSASGSDGVRETKVRAEAKLSEVRARVAALQRVERALASLTEACPGCGPSEHCPILSALVDEDSPVDGLVHPGASL